MGLKWAEALPLALPFYLVKIWKTLNKRNELTPFEIVFSHPLPTSTSKPSIPVLIGHYGDLSEQFDIMTSYIHILICLEHIIDR